MIKGNTTVKDVNMLPPDRIHEVRQTQREDVLLNKWPVLFNNAHVMKDKGR